MSTVWKRLQKAVGRQAKSELDDAETAPQENIHSRVKAKTTQQQSNPGRPKPKNHQIEASYEAEEMRDILQLFNKLEELVVEGDPRVKHALDRRPIVQHALLEGQNTERSEISPRAAPKLQFRSPREPTFLREESGISGQPTLYKQKQLTVSDLAASQSPNQTQYLNDRYLTKNGLTFNQTMPEQGVLNNTYNINNYQGGRAYKHPDGTILAKTNGPVIQSGRIQDINPTFKVSLPEPQRVSRNPMKSKTEVEVPKLDLHEFNYETPRGNSKVQVKLRGDDVYGKQARKETFNSQIDFHQLRMHHFNYANPKAGYQVRVSLDNLQLPDDKVEVEGLTKQNAPTNQQQTQAIFQNITLPQTIKRRDNLKWTNATSKVITSDGGSISCLGCKVTIPKNAVPNKALIRLSIMDIREIPLNSRSTGTNQKAQDLLPISAAISMEPQNLFLQKPLTVRLITSVGKVNEPEGIVLGASRFKPNAKQFEGAEGDIKAKDVVVKYSNVYTNENWQSLDEDLFRSSDAVIFQIKQLAKICAFLQELENDKIIKKVAVFMFQSLERRKKQFLSILICEDQPHIIQKGIESMPEWLHYMDSCVNVAMEKGTNLVVFLEPEDRTLCNIDINKMEIPSENLWRPECIIRKHFMVTLHKLDVEASIQIMVNEANYSMATSFLWQMQKKAIFLPDPVPLGNYTLDEEVIENSLPEELTKEYSTLYKHVSWKPETPNENEVTNRSILQYAKM